jgi:hypothetical protein
MKSGVVVTGMLGVVVRDAYIVIANSGVLVLVPSIVTEPVADTLDVIVYVPVPVKVTEPVPVILDVIVFVGINEVVNDPDSVAGTLGDTESDSVIETVGSLLDVTDIVRVIVEDAVVVLVIDRLAGIDGVNVPLTDAASKPTLISMPHAWGSVSVAE